MVRLIETATVPIFTVDSDGRINGWNPKVDDLTGLLVEEAMGKSLVQDLAFQGSTTDVLYRALRGFSALLQLCLRNKFSCAENEHVNGFIEAGEEDRNVEIKLRVFGSEQSENAVFLIVNACASGDYANNIIGVCLVGQDATGQRVMMDRFVNIQADYKSIVHSPNPLIPPIFASDENACCSEWDSAMEKLTGWSGHEIIGKLLVGEVFGSCCRLRGSEALTKFTVILHNATTGQETDKFPFSSFNRNGKFIQAQLTANTRTNMDGEIIGAFCFLQIASPELQQALEVQRQQENKCLARTKELAYICQEIKNPLGGIRFTNSWIRPSFGIPCTSSLLEASLTRSVVTSAPSSRAALSSRLKLGNSVRRVRSNPSSIRIQLMFPLHQIVFRLYQLGRALYPICNRSKAISMYKGARAFLPQWT